MLAVDMFCRSDDAPALKVIRFFFIYTNKLVLLYFAWGTYSGLVLAIFLFFGSLFTLGMQIGLSLVVRICIPHPCTSVAHRCCTSKCIRRSAPI